jgi:hypothetical protein
LLLQDLEPAQQHVVAGLWLSWLWLFKGLWTPSHTDSFSTNPSSSSICGTAFMFAAF